MRIFLLTITLIITSSAICQNLGQVLNNEKILGKNHIDNTDITGIEYIFPERIHDLYLDTTSGYLTVQLRGVSKNGKWLNNSGDVIQYDLKNQKVLWSKKMAYQVSYIQQFSNTMIQTEGGKSYCLDIHSGNELWEVKNNMYIVDPDMNIGIGYKYRNSSGYSNELEGIDLTNGFKIWQRELNREYGWNSAFYINDSTLVVVAAGLHSININTGKGWDFDAITGKKDYTGTIAANAIGVAAGLLTGTFLMSTGNDLVRDLVSNTIIDSTFLYFASKDKISKLNKLTGDIEWKFLFGKDLASKSSIFMNDSVVFMINKGIAFMGERQLKFGKPFFAAFNRHTGDQIFFTLISEKEEPIHDFQIKGDQIYLIFENKMMKYSMNTGTMTGERYFSKDEHGDLRYFVGNHVFISTPDGGFQNLYETDSTKVFIHTSDAKTYAVDSDLNITKSFDLTDFSYYYLRTNDYKFIFKDIKTQIVNNTGKIVAEIEVSSDAFIVNDMLYDWNENKFVAIDLRKLINKVLVQ